jgi:hypothetical protein
MSDTFSIRLERPQPSQLYISEAKLAPVRDALHADPDHALSPVPVKELDGQMILTDGHTRALAALLAGRVTIGAYRETDALNWDAYRICVKWCKDKGILTISDLRHRIISPEDYQRLWLDRCRRMHEGLHDNTNT